MNEEVFYRFEPNIDDGILLVYFKDSNEIYEMTEPFYIFLEEVEKETERLKLIQIYKEIYPELDEKEINHSIDKIIESLLNLSIIMEV